MDIRGRGLAHLILRKRVLRLRLYSVFLIIGLALIVFVWDSHWLHKSFEMWESFSLSSLLDDDPKCSASGLSPELYQALCSNEPTVIMSNIDFMSESLSFDPLDSGLRINRPMMALLYKAPLEIDPYGSLSSTILRDFSYNTKSLEVIFTLKDDIKFNDGSPISLADLTLSIKRGLLNLSHLDTSKQLIGFDEWLKLPNPLYNMPEGMVESVDTNSLILRFNDPVFKPLDLFTWLQFSVIPRRCVDLDTNSLICKVPPFSGDYYLYRLEPPFIQFKRRLNKSSELPAVLWVFSLPPWQLVDLVDCVQSNHVVIAEGIYLPPEHVSTLTRTMRVNSTSEHRFLALIMNNNAKPFDDVRVRLFFAREYRRTIVGKLGFCDWSFFPRLTPGYLSRINLDMGVRPFYADEEAQILEKLRRNPPVWLKTSFHGGEAPFQLYLKETLNRLGIAPSEVVDLSDKADKIKAWNSGRFNINVFYGGFYNPDPRAYLNYLLSVRRFNYFSGIYDDKKLQSLLSGIKDSDIYGIDLKQLERINKYIYSQSIFATVIHYGMYQLTKRGSNLSVMDKYTLNFSNYYLRDSAKKKKLSPVEYLKTLTPPISRNLGD